MREFTVTLVDDSPERAEAVAFFSQLKRPIRAKSVLPPEIDSMNFDDAQLFLDRNPQQERWSLLRIFPEDNVLDDDLHRLEYLPELSRVCLHGVGNGALLHLRHLKHLVGLVVYSSAITDDSLIHLHNLKSLRTIDFQGSPNITGAAFMSVVDTLPLIERSYPPQDRA